MKQVKLDQVRLYCFVLYVLRTHGLGKRNESSIYHFNSDLGLRIFDQYQYLMMRSFLYHLYSLTTIVASLSLGNFDQVGPDGDAVQSITYIPTDNSEDPSEDSALGLDTTIPSWADVTGTEQAQAINGACSSPNKKRRRGESNYCSPTAAPPPLQFRPDSNQVGSGPGSEQKMTGGSTTTTGQQDSSQSGLLLGKGRFDELQLVPWSSTQSACPENRPVAVCAGADMQPWELDQGWRQIPFSSPLPSPVELLYWPYCRLCMLYVAFYFQNPTLSWSFLSRRKNTSRKKEKKE